MQQLERGRLLDQEHARGEQARAETSLVVQPDAALALPGGLGRAPLLGLVSACGLLLVALANSGARDGAVWAGTLFWLGLLLIVAPTALRLLGPAATRQERLALVALLACALYAVKMMHSPTSFTFSDELLHLRGADDVARSGALFPENPLLPVGPLFPGLVSATVALHKIGGLSLFAAGALTLGAARLILALALFLFYEQVGRSARLAGIATLLYTANPSFLFFSAQYSYESLALPLAAITLFAAARRSFGTRARVGLTLLALLALGAVVVTHHLTSYALTAFLALWALVASLLGARQEDRWAPGGLALLALVASLSWLAYIATVTFSYLAAPIRGAAAGALELIAGEAQSRELFRAANGELAPLPERLAGFASVILILLGLPLGLRRVWRDYRRSAVALALGLATLAYPASLGLRLSERGAEIANRSSSFVFLAVAFVLACWAAHLVARPGPLRLRQLSLGATATLIFAGGAVVGWAPWARLPGPYLPAADTRSIEAQGLAAAQWASAALGPNQRIVADRTNRLLLGTYGRQRPVTSYSDKLRTAQIIFAPTLGPSERDILRRGQVRYVVVDRRLGEALPSVATYVERGEDRLPYFQAPIPRAALDKFDTIPDVSRVFDSGDIVIYDVGALSHAP
jgi:hypothetical protein